MTTTTLREKNGIASPASGNDAADTESPSPVPIAAVPDADGMTDEALATLAITVPQKIAERKAKREAQFFELVREQAAVLGVTPTRLAAAISAKATAQGTSNGGALDGRSIVRPKYRHPTNHAQTWSGRGGTPPKWFSDYLAAGGSEAELIIPPEGDQ
jgi:DNA-binding protein H-NS